MKKLAGMMPPTLVWAEEGKNGLFGPPPSPSMVAGTSTGFRIRSRWGASERSFTASTTPITIAMSATASPAQSSVRSRAGESRRAHKAACSIRTSVPATAQAMWASRSRW